jgi:hypothetical protein
MSFHRKSHGSFITFLQGVPSCRRRVTYTTSHSRSRLKMDAISSSIRPLCPPETNAATNGTYKLSQSPYCYCCHRQQDIKRTEWVVCSGKVFMQNFMKNVIPSSTLCMYQLFHMAPKPTKITISRYCKSVFPCTLRRNQRKELFCSIRYLLFDVISIARWDTYCSV